MHPLLLRQLRKTFSGKPARGPELEALVQAVDDAYVAADDDRRQLERSLQLASDELYERNRRLEQELEERKRLELELQQAEKLRAVGQLAAGVAHEINTPVQFIGDSLSLLRDAFGDLDQVVTAMLDPGEDAEAVRARAAELDLEFLRAEIPRALARCVSGNDRITTIVRALRSLAHEDGYEQEYADLHEAIENTLTVVAGELRQVADVEVELASSRTIRCHIGEIQQVLLHLLFNAGNAIAERVGETAERGTIRVAARDDGADVVITISDTGTGIDPSIRDRIFEPFFTTKPVGSGTGQGLSISRVLIVDRHRGQLTFDSTVGAGTTFTVRLPIGGSTPSRPTRWHVG